MRIRVEAARVRAPLLTSNFPFLSIGKIGRRIRPGTACQAIRWRPRHSMKGTKQSGIAAV